MQRLPFARLALILLCLAAVAASAETLVVRPLPGKNVNVPDLLSTAGVSERYCYETFCVVPSTNALQLTATRALEDGKNVRVESLPDAQKIFFARGTYDGKRDAFEKDFPGKDELHTSSSMSQAALILKSFLQPAWRDEILARGIVIGEPLAPMALSVFGQRSEVEALQKLPFVATLREIPAGLKRNRIDPPDPRDDGSEIPTTVLAFETADRTVLNLLTARLGQEPAVEYRMTAAAGYIVPMTLSEAYAFSALPEVILVSRHSVGAKPSDERANRIVSGDYLSVGSSWPVYVNDFEALSNSGPPYFWDRYLTSLAGLGINPANQTIGFLDTGVDSGLQGNVATPTPDCPVALTRPDGGCNLLTTTDVTTQFGDPATRANDYEASHGTLTTAIAAGYPGPTPDDRDTKNYAFAQGIAQGARIAMAKITNLCPQGATTYRQVTAGGSEQGFSEQVMSRTLRYSLVELSRTGALPDCVFGAGASIFNHSWNGDGTDPANAIAYDDSAMILDKTSRTLGSVDFKFGVTGAENPQPGSPWPALHIVSAGNMITGSTGSYSIQVTTPAMAKNVITVGATEGLNATERHLHGDYDYNSACWDAGLGTAVSDYSRQLAAFSLAGFPNERLKPDLVAPGTVNYGRRSSDMVCTGCSYRTEGNNVWNYGTSFSAPLVTGASALVRDWLRTLGHQSPSPAMVKATVLAGTKSLVWERRSPDPDTCYSETNDHWPCRIDQVGAVTFPPAPMRPAPDRYQGWGGLSLDRFFRTSNYYYFSDQVQIMTTGGIWGPKTLTVTDPNEPVTIMVVWTDRFSQPPVQAGNNLLNDLDLWVTATGWVGEEEVSYWWTGNDYYTSIDDWNRRPYSLQRLYPTYFDHKNNYEKIDIYRLPPDTTTFTIYVTGWNVGADAIDPTAPATGNPRQDFALAVINGHE